MRVKLRFATQAQVFVLAILALAWHAVCQASGGYIMKVERLEGGYSIQVPDHLHAKRSSPAEDFAFYSIQDSKRGRVLLQIYIGNHPEQPVEHVGPISQSLKPIGGFPAASGKWLCGKDTYCGEVRIQLLKGEGWPTFAHLFYRNLSLSDLAMVERIIDTFAKEPQDQ